MLEKKLPMRRCIGCMQSFPKEELVRIVSTEKGIVADTNAVLPGRGAYLCKNENCVKKAIKKNAFSRNFKVALSEEAAEDLIQLINSISNKDA